MRDFFQFAADLPVAGFSVTIPHKRRVIRYLDHVDPLARRIGAVNTVWRKAGKWRGANTDAAAVSGPLSKLIRLAGATALIVGNGGAARGAACALIDAGAKVSLTGRNPDRVRALARLTGCDPLSHDQALASYFDIVVNATPLGMNDGDPLPMDVDRISPDTFVGEVVMKQEITPFLAAARSRGCEIQVGTDMLFEQIPAYLEFFGFRTTTPDELRAVAQINY